MNKKTLIIIGLQTFIIIMLFWVLVFYGKDEFEAATAEKGETITSPSLVTTVNGVATVTLSNEAQKQSGISTSPLQSATYESAVLAFGTVIGIDSLVEARARYFSARAEAEMARTAIANSKQEYERMRLLNQDGRNVSDRAVAMAEAAWKADLARLSANETMVQGIRDTLRQQWGETLTALALQQPATETFQKLMKRQETLLQITLSIDTTSPTPSSTLLIGMPDSPQPIRATFVAPAPQADSTIQGKTFYYRAPAAELRMGMRVSARLSDADKVQSGVIVPANAVVWYANQPWVYRKQDNEKFVRTPITTDIEVENGWFNTNGLKSGDTVVTTGAQLLLSEEFKYQIKNENED